MKTILLASLLLSLAACSGSEGSPSDMSPDAASPDGAADAMPQPEGWVDPEPNGSELVLGYDVLLKLDIQLSDESLAKLRDDPRTYVPGYLVHEGTTYGPVGIRLKGMNSFEPIDKKPSMRININEYVHGATFYGLKDLTLNNMSDDPSLMHERLAYKVAREAGIPASRCNHALISINGEDRGLYANVETVKTRMISRWFPDHSGKLWGMPDVDFVTADVPRFELREGVEGIEGRANLEDAAVALTIADADEAMAAVDEYIDVASFVKFWAMEAVIAQFDAQPFFHDDVFLYDDPQSGKMHFIPWGMDETWLSADHYVFTTTGILANRCQESVQCKQNFETQVWNIYDQTVAWGLEADYHRIKDDIAPYVSTGVYQPFTAAEIAEGQQQMYWFIHGRGESLITALNEAPPP